MKREYLIVIVVSLFVTLFSSSCVRQEKVTLLQTFCMENQSKFDCDVDIYVYSGTQLVDSSFFSLAPMECDSSTLHVFQHDHTGFVPFYAITTLIGTNSFYSRAHGAHCMVETNIHFSNDSVYEWVQELRPENPVLHLPENIYWEFVRNDGNMWNANHFFQCIIPREIQQ